MHMNINETGKKETIIEFKNGNTTAGDNVAANAENTPAPDKYIRSGKGPAVVNPAALYNEVHRAAPFRKTSNFQYFIRILHACQGAVL